VTDTDSLGEIVRRSELLAATFAGQTAICLLAAERFLKLSQHQPRLTVSRVTGGIRVCTDNFARQVTLEMSGGSQAIFEDNYFDLLPGESRTVRLLHAPDASKVSVSAVMARPVELSL
jgi:beta-mannosidase